MCGGVHGLVEFRRVAETDALDPVVELLVALPVLLREVIDRHKVSVRYHEVILQLLEIAVQLEVRLEEGVSCILP
jgi:hypothetical protein